MPDKVEFYFIKRKGSKELTVAQKDIWFERDDEPKEDWWWVVGSDHKVDINDYEIIQKILLPEESDKVEDQGKAQEKASKEGDKK